MHDFEVNDFDEYGDEDNYNNEDNNVLHPPIVEEFEYCQLSDGEKNSGKIKIENILKENERIGTEIPIENLENIELIEL